jgi:uncharacterized protein YecT (DUF1311 family)
MIARTLAALTMAAFPILTTLSAAAQDVERAAPPDPMVQMDRILDAQLKAVNDLLSPDLQQSLAASQRTWVAHRDQQCAFELRFGQEQGRARLREDNGREAACVARFNQQRLTELQRYLTTLMEFARKPQKSDLELPVQKCRLDGLPKKFEVQAVGTYAGLTVAGVKLDDSTEEVRNAKVIVNRPGGVPTVLVLMAFDPVVWQVSHTPGTNIVAVVVGGHYRQAVLGVPKATPIQLNTRRDNDGCGPFYAYDAGADLARANQHLKRITGRAIDRLVLRPAGDRFIVGDESGIDEAALVSSAERTIGEYGGIAVGIGEAGIAALAAQGKIRPATPADIEAWMIRRADANRPARHRMKPGSTFVILESFDMPAGLAEPTAPSFILPEDTPMPTGQIKPVWFYRMDTNGGCQFGRARTECPK